MASFRYDKQYNGSGYCYRADGKTQRLQNEKTDQQN
ncbi:hypothetical protein P298_11640 [Salmonella enterica subsp. arizonae serovar 18:z4,z23:- str. CVM N26626]|uniref:Uncharacterized protein n=1 Tax=Salmonella enterica subsp. arizonae serovar 18:z4,z23:- str. CVM N26626 TaxID=1395119 RepID=A0A3S5YLZ5_SALER|nr:hypothetical protein P298_11640 [Salmonella enterica subsp. arizonae serovar 18:z4,z23:- str. CVM N26626]OLW24431.1 hypothetical protein P289_13630 [Salmonella enterica subsp. arizonae serovar 18:z4,z23:- str. CVM N9135]OLY42521.1 hypothetical protein P282_04435 [Salmonella enterica subsp. arizonae serovar 18:z4,z23:- str. CVM 32457]TII20362.1 hypothetical protein P281_13365 [Salmonella enterica subsp. arizonae serovar 18:z4,z23:- str. CVM 32450]